MAYQIILAVVMMATLVGDVQSNPVQLRGGIMVDDGKCCVEGELMGLWLNIEAGPEAGALSGTYVIAGNYKTGENFEGTLSILEDAGVYTLIYDVTYDKKFGPARYEGIAVKKGIHILGYAQNEDAESKCEIYTAAFDDASEYDAVFQMAQPVD
jgi:hypothetical protein